MQLEVFERRNLEAQIADRYGLLLNQLTHSEVELKRIELEIIEVARLIVAEADAEVATV
jgi:hypothetical protein